MRNLRRDLISSRCAWCNRIWTGKQWVNERRPEERVLYTFGICKNCVVINFAGKPEEARLRLIHCFESEDAGKVESPAANMELALTI